jgi:hypothetical protein
MDNQNSGYRRLGLLSVFAVILIWSPALSAVQTEQTDTKKVAGETNTVEELEGESSETKTEFPEWNEVESVVNGHFSDGSGKKTTRRRIYRRREQSEQLQENDLITQQDISGLFKKIETLGWEISKQDRKNILDRLLSENDFLVRQLRTTHGRQFMRKISTLPGGYDRIDRLRKMPHGKYRIQEFIKGPDGYKMIEYMTTTKYGKNLGKQLSRAKSGRNFHEPTCLLYTQKDVLDSLQKIYQADRTEAERRQSEESKSTSTNKTKTNKSAR